MAADLEDNHGRSTHSADSSAAPTVGTSLEDIRDRQGKRIARATNGRGAIEDNGSLDWTRQGSLFIERSGRKALRVEFTVLISSCWVLHEKGSNSKHM